MATIAEIAPQEALARLAEFAVVDVRAAQVSGREPAAVAAWLREPLGGQGLGLEEPTRASVDRALAFVAESLRAAGAPPDLDLSLASFRRALAAL